ncbi:MAG: peptide ABC transporter ATP-binding protein, partial [Oscillospiraceae bacterium]
DINEASAALSLEGDVPSPVNPPSGCKFRTRCRYAMGICAEECPKWKEVAPEHFAACHLLDK